MTELKNMAGEVVVRAETLFEALAAFQAELPHVATEQVAEVVKDGKKLYEYAYADLATVANAVLPALGRHGLSYTSVVKRVDGKKALICQLRHVSGDMDVSEWELPDTANAQALGSAITYGRRYCLLAMTGVHPAGEDDDGAKATDYARRRDAWETEQPAKSPEDAAIEKINSTEDVDELTKFYHVVGKAGHMTDKVRGAFERRGAELKALLAARAADYARRVQDEAAEGPVVDVRANGHTTEVPFDEAGTETAGIGTLLDDGDTIPFSEADMTSPEMTATDDDLGGADPDNDPPDEFQEAHDAAMELGGPEERTEEPDPDPRQDARNAASAATAAAKALRSSRKPQADG